VTVIRRSLHDHETRPGLPLDVSALTTSAVLLVCLVVGGCSRSQRHAPEEPSPLETLVMQTAAHDPLLESQSRGREVFSHYCAICHGIDGKGDGFNSTNLDASPRDFSSEDFWRQAQPQRLLLAFSKGGEALGKSVLMPSWERTLNDLQKHDVIAFLSTLAAPETSPLRDDTPPANND
jgi:mono/diheme cytochrome c family protein